MNAKNYWPANIKPQDKNLFSWVFEVTPQTLTPSKYESAFYINSELNTGLLKHISNFYAEKYSFIKKLFIVSGSILRGRFLFFCKQKVCIACNPWSNNYFHWFTEVLPRVMEADALQKELLFLFPFELNEQYQLPSLSRLNIRYKSIAGGCFFAKTLYFSQPSREFTGHYNTNHFKKLQSVFQKQETGMRKIYVHRNSDKRIVINSDEVKNCFFRFGFQVVELENSTLENQIELFSQTTVFASIHGAALTNMLFMKEGSTILEFGLSGEKYDKCYFNMARELNHAYYYQSCFSPDAGATYSEANLIVDIKELESILIAISISQITEPHLA